MNCELLTKFEKQTQKEFLNLMFKPKSTSLIVTVNERVFFGDPYHLYAIEKTKFVFNTDLPHYKIKKETFERNVLELFTSAKPIYKTDNLVQFHKKTLCKFTNNDFNVYCNLDYLKYFDDSCTFYALGSTSPVYVLNQNNDIIGIVYPVRYNGGNNND